VKYSHSLTYVKVVLHGTLSNLNFTQVRIFLNSIQFILSHAGKITKVCFELYNKEIKTMLSTYFCHHSQVLCLFPTGCKILFRDFFVCLQWPAKMYIKSNLYKSCIV
jgi:hypothetical protein